MTDSPRLLHVFPSFGPGGTQLRMVSIMNCLGPSFSHHIVSLDEDFGASKALSGRIQAVVTGPPPKSRSVPYLLVLRRMIAGSGRVVIRSSSETATPIRLAPRSSASKRPGEASDADSDSDIFPGSSICLDQWARRARVFAKSSLARVLCPRYDTGVWRNV